MQRELPCEGGDERRAHGAFGKQVADQVGDAGGDAKRVVGVAGAEVERQDLVADQPEDAAGDGGQPEDSGRPGQARMSAFALGASAGLSESAISQRSVAWRFVCAPGTRPEGEQTVQSQGFGET